jgi:hypothetical protein
MACEAEHLTTRDMNTNTHERPAEPRRELRNGPRTEADFAMPAMRRRPRRSHSSNVHAKRMLQLTAIPAVDDRQDPSAKTTEPTAVPSA